MKRLTQQCGGGCDKTKVCLWLTVERLKNTDAVHQYWLQMVAN